MDYQRTVLKNGLRLVTVPMPQVDSVTVMVLVGVGSRYEAKKVTGLSHFLEHMAFKGTKKRPSTLEIASLVEGIGGEFNAATSKDNTSYYIKSASKYLPLLLDVLSDMLLNSLFKKEEIEREKGVILEEMNMREDMPIYKVGEVFETLLYGKTPLGRRIIGEKEVIKKLRRDDFIKYLEEFYAPGNTVVVIAGEIGQSTNKYQSSNQLINTNQLIEKYLGSWKKQPFKQFEKTSDKQKKPALEVVYKKTEQAHLCLGVRAYALDHPDRYALSVLSTILGGGMSSRLFLEVRERRGLAYYVKSASERYQDVGYFVTQAGVDLQRIEEAVRVILKEYDKVKSQKFKVKSQELKKAKEFLKGRLILELEDSKNFASLYGTQEILEGKIRTSEEMMKGIDKVTVNDVLRVAKDIFRPERLNLAVIGPFKDKQRFKKLLVNSF